MSEPGATEQLDVTGSRGAQASRLARYAGAAVAGLLLVAVLVGLWWDQEPEAFDVEAAALARAGSPEVAGTRGYATTATLMAVAEAILDKPGGYLSNDLAPPGVWLDNQPNWEFGVLTQVRDMARAMRVDFSRSQSQSSEDPDLSIAEGHFFIDNESWMLPEAEDEYRAGIRRIGRYLERLSDPRDRDAQFYTRSDNLRRWLAGVETRLGSLSQRLSASVGKRQLDLGLAGDAAAGQSTATDSESELRTPWLEVDDVFYESRGQAWALLHLLRAVEVDFADVLEKKNARVSLQQIIRELESTQDEVWAPMIFNGSGFGFLANHSLVMGSYISRANAAIIDLRTLLGEG